MILNAFEHGGTVQEPIFGRNGIPIAHESLARPRRDQNAYPIYPISLHFYEHGAAIEFDLMTSALGLRRAHELPVTLNISVASSLSPIFWDEMNKRLIGHDPTQIIFEILEHDVAPDADISRLISMKEQGYRFALDDFDTGELHDRRLKVFGEISDLIKIDGSVIRRGLDEKCQSLGTLVDGLRNTNPNAALIAEFVQTGDEAQALFAMGFAGVQGRDLRHMDFINAAEADHNGFDTK